MVKQLTEWLYELNSIAVLILPILTFLSLIIPKIRNWIKRGLKKFIGVDELHKEIKTGFSRIEEVSKQCNDINNMLKEHMEKDEEKMRAQMSNLKDSLMRAFHFYIDRGYITLEELDSLQEVYKSYRTFHGNGLFQKLWEEQILKLPSKPKI